jgi:hypothetical protein
MDCLALRPEDRPASAAVLAAELAASVDEPVTGPIPVPFGLRATEILPASAVTTPLRAGEVSGGGGARPHRRVLAVVAAAVAVAVAVIIAVALAGSGPSHRATNAATSGKTTSATTSSSTTPGSTTSESTTTATAPTTSTIPDTHQAPPSSPQAAIADARIAINHAETNGQLDPGAANGLNGQLDSIAQALGADNTQAAAQQSTALLQQLGHLGQSGQLGSVGLAQLTRSLDELTALIPAAQAQPGPAGPGPVAPGPVAHGHGPTPKHGNKQRR